LIVSKNGPIISYKETLSPFH